MVGGGFDGGFGAIAYLMINAAGVAKAIGHGMKNFLSHSRIDWGGSVVVEIDHVTMNCRHYIKDNSPV